MDAPLHCALSPHGCPRRVRRPPAGRCRAVSLGGDRGEHLPKVGQCAPRRSWPRSGPACGAGTARRARSRSTPRRPGWSDCPPRPRSVPDEEVRPRFHPADWSEIDGIVNFAIAEGTVAEARMRIVDEQRRGRCRTVRTRSKPVPLDTPGRHTYVLMGILQEVAQPPEATAAQTPLTGDWRRSREAFLLDAGRALAEAGSTEEVLRVAGSLSMPGFSPDGLAVFGVVGRAADGHRAPRAQRRRRGAVHRHAPGDRLPGRRGRADRAGDLPGVARGVPAALPGHLAPRRGVRTPVLGLPAADLVRAHHGRLDGRVPAQRGLLAGRALRAVDGGQDAGTGADPRRCRRDRARAVAGPPEGDEAVPGPGCARADGGGALRPDGRGAPGRRRLVRRDPAPQRPYRPRHR